jgi:hypothetical protein
MRNIPTFAPDAQVPRLRMTGHPDPQFALEDYFFRFIPPYATRERTFNQLTHLVLQYVSTDPNHAVRHLNFQVATRLQTYCVNQALVKDFTLVNIA